MSNQPTLADQYIEARRLNDLLTWVTCNRVTRLFDNVGGVSTHVIETAALTAGVDRALVVLGCTHLLGAGLPKAAMALGLRVME